MKKSIRIIFLLSLLISFSQLLKASHGLPLVNATYTVGTAGITVTASSDAATCGSGPFWMQTKVSCNPLAFSNIPPPSSSLLSNGLTFLNIILYFR